MTPEAENKVSKVIAWSLYWMWRGVWPDVDWDDRAINESRKLTPLAGDGNNYYFCVLWGIKADLEALYKTLHLPNMNSRRPCAWCPCNTTTMPHTEFRREHASWMDHIYTKTDWATSEFRTHVFFLGYLESPYLQYCRT